MCIFMYAVCQDRREGEAQLYESERGITVVIYTTSWWLVTKNFLTVISNDNV